MKLIEAIASKSIKGVRMTLLERLRYWRHERSCNAYPQIFSDLEKWHEEGVLSAEELSHYRGIAFASLGKYVERRNAVLYAAYERQSAGSTHA